MIYLYETTNDLSPLDLLRHQSDIFVGALTLGERVSLCASGPIERIDRPRPSVLPGAMPPGAKPGAGLFVPANVLLDPAVATEGPEEAAFAGERLAWMRLGAPRAARFDRSAPERSAEGLPRRQAEARFIDHPWDIVRALPRLLAEDCARGSRMAEPKPTVAPSAVIDASAGPVVIEAGAVIEPLAYIVGPAWIGRGAVVKAHAAIRQSVIGEVSRVGGEVSSSQICPYSNKQHDGFLGHSVVGSWVNIGAGATGSNLKNTYGEIRVDGSGTGLNYLGQIVGDHTKIGIQAVMDTGSIYGVCSNVLATGGPLPKRIRSFDFCGQPAEIEAVIRTARTMMARRKIELDPVMEKLIRAYARG